jgi:hypothetical protein
MDWESLYGSYARYEERLREVERERQAEQLWANTHPRREWRSYWHSWSKGLVAWGVSLNARCAAYFEKLTTLLSDQEG